MKDVNCLCKSRYANNPVFIRLMDADLQCTWTYVRHRLPILRHAAPLQFIDFNACQPPSQIRKVSQCTPAAIDKNSGLLLLHCFHLYLLPIIRNFI
jgi:hypothetical protein